MADPKEETTITATMLPPGPKGHWLMGVLPALEKDPLGFLMSVRSYGDLVYLPVVSWAMLINDPALIEQVLVRDNKRMAKGLVALRGRPLLGNGLLLSDGDFWLRQRRLAQPAFHRDRISAYSTTMVAHTQTLMDRWADGAVRDIHADLMHVTLAITAKTLFNYNVTDEVVTGVGRVLAVALTEWNKRSFRWPFADRLPLPANFRFRKAVAWLDQLVYGLIAERRASGDDPGDLLSMLLTAIDDEGHGMTDHQLRDEVMNILLAGHETTANTLAWACHLLSVHPEVETKLLAEIDQVLAGRPPTLQDLPNLPYLDMVLTESIRFYPAVWSYSRQPLDDYELRGYRIPKGSTLIISPYVMHRDPRYFPEPERFHPERWADGLMKRIPTYAYIPFSGGPRVCIGKQFALMEGALVLATILQQYRLGAVPGRVVEPIPEITLRPKGGLPMKLHRRHQ
jgi:cytochrome P450